MHFAAFAAHQLDMADEAAEGGVFGPAPSTPPTRAASPSRDGAYAGVTLESEAVALIRELFARQLERAAAGAAAPNESVEGDSEARRAFWLLLSPTAQRELFLQMAKLRTFWPRIRTCVGAPPFSFLRPQDNAILNPSGIAVGRANMAAETPISSSNEIGKGQFSDAFNRSYRLFTDDNTRSSEIPVVRARNAKRLVLDVKLPKMRLATRHEIFKQSRGRDGGIVYPRAGETLRLFPNEALGGEAIRVVVRTVESRGQRSPVARLYCSTT